MSYFARILKRFLIYCGNSLTMFHMFHSSLTKFRWEMGRGEGREGRGRGQEPSRARDQPLEGATRFIVARGSFWKTRIQHQKPNMAPSQVSPSREKVMLDLGIDPPTKNGSGLLG